MHDLALSIDDNLWLKFRKVYSVWRSFLGSDACLWCWSDRVWPEPGLGLGGEGSSCLLLRTAWRQATAPWPGKAQTASLLPNAVCAVQSSLTVSSCLPLHHTFSFMLSRLWAAEPHWELPYNNVYQYHQKICFKWFKNCSKEIVVGSWTINVVLIADVTQISRISTHLFSLLPYQGS